MITLMNAKSSFESLLIEKIATLLKEDLPKYLQIISSSQQIDQKCFHPLVVEY